MLIKVLFLDTVVKCTHLEDPEHGIVSLSDGENLESVATYSCSNGYILNGNSERECLPTEIWSGCTPTCTGVNYVGVHFIVEYFPSVVSCDTLERPDNGRISYSNSTEYGSVATFSCNAGYSVSGHNQRMCMENGKWSGSTPNCTGMITYSKSYCYTSQYFHLR